MITVYSYQDAKFVPNTHELGWDWAVDNGNLIVRTRDGDPIATYAPGAWQMVVDNDPVEASQ